eukprot:CAMPEP_0115865450 /NCGR_PEP_ID=MMETSP0287-20121206/19727_1 /TAXON_ID=412157 /ORGANISM="Chrysochromulina rotalis, Strain UIO044" /LENGTH=204 /DNA_ID=CAMNT_0003319961 /DNA_START=18 /DNA_END=632 /DNA_ORIENTATION=+
MSNGNDDLLRVPDVDLGDASLAGSAALEKMQAEREKRLEALGASSTPPPPPQHPQRLSVFSVSDASIGRDEAEKRLQRMRQKENAELEDPNADAIARAKRGAKQWQDAGLAERAYKELKSVESFCSYTSDVGARFHLALADAAERAGQSAEAKRLRMRVMSDAQSSSQRWAAGQALQKDSPGSSASSPPSNPELNRLWQMPKWD